MGSLAPVAPKLAKLLPVLSSDHDGEVVATARAIGRTLQSAGLDWHSLAQALTMPQPDPKPARAQSRWSCDDDRPNHDPADWYGMAKWARDNDFGRLNDRERKFLMEMAAPLRMRQGRTPSEKQRKWIATLYYTLRNWID